MRTFFFGTLRHAPLRRVVLGGDLPLDPAVLPGHVAWQAADPVFADLRPGAATAEGGLCGPLTEEAGARLAFYAETCGLRPVTVTVQQSGAAVTARAWMPEPAVTGTGGPWRLAQWQDRWGAAVTATAADIMALRGPGALPDRYPLMLVRGSARARAEAEPAPARLRRAAGPADVAVAARRQPYARFFAVEEYDLCFRRFDGALSEAVNRAVFVTGDAATVLPYDPRRDRVLLIEQFRAGPFARGAANPWLLEPIAGRIDPGETPEEAVRREAVEEAGLTLGALHPVGRYYPTPAAKSEFLHSFVGLADLPDGIAGIAGVAAEAEDIRSHVVGYDAFREIVATPEAACGPLLLTAFWLDAHRAALRAAAGGDCL